MKKAPTTSPFIVIALAILALFILKGGELPYQSTFQIIKGAGPEGRLPVPAAESAETRLDLNSASIEELTLLPGIGRILAERIVARRGEGGFKSVDQVGGVHGIGREKLDTMKRYVHIPRPRPKPGPESGKTGGKER